MNVFRCPNGHDCPPGYESDAKFSEGKGDCPECGAFFVMRSVPDGTPINYAKIKEVALKPASTWAYFTPGPIGANDLLKTLRAVDALLSKPQGSIVWAGKLRDALSDAKNACERALHVGVMK